MPIQLRNVAGCDSTWGLRLTSQARVDLLAEYFGLDLIPWQRDLFDAVGGQERPKIYYLSVPRKSGKTYALACFVLTELMLEPESAVYVFSDSERNLKAVLFHELQQIVGMAPRSQDWKVHFDRIVYAPTGAFVMVRPSNHQATQGINPTLCVMDEVHLQRSDLVWNGAIMAGAARPRPMMLAATTPGYDTTSLAHTLDVQVRMGEVPGRLFEPADLQGAYQDRAQWALANPALGFTFELDSLESDHALMPEHEFKRFRLGMWTATAEAWLPFGRWDALAGPVRDPEGPVWFGFDGSFSGDSTALVGVTEDGYVWVEGLWENPGRRGWRVPRDEVDTAVEMAFAKYDVRCLAADPPYHEQAIADWDRRWPGRVLEFPTNSRARMAPACTAFYTAVLEGHLSHSGDRALARHLANCVVKSSLLGDYVTKEDKNSPRKIDAAVAAIVALHARSAQPVRPALPPVACRVA